MAERNNRLKTLIRSDFSVGYGDITDRSPGAEKYSAGRHNSGTAVAKAQLSDIICAVRNELGFIY